MLVACVDVTEARRASGELESHLHFTRALIDAIPSPVYYKDRQGRYQIHNRAWDELFGGGANWIGKTVFDMFDANIARAAQRARPRALRAAVVDHVRAAHADRFAARCARCSTTR